MIVLGWKKKKKQENLGFISASKISSNYTKSTPGCYRLRALVDSALNPTQDIS